MSAILKEQDARFRGLNLKVAVFIVLALVIGAVLLAGLAVRQGIFTPKTPVVFQAASGEGIGVGMAVKLSGFKVGEVSRVALGEDARVDVEMNIENRYMKWVKADSVAVLAREGMIGDSFIDITAGSPTLPSLEAGGAVRFEPGRGLADIAQDMRNRVVPVIDNVNTLLRDTNDPKGDLHQTLRGMQALLADLRKTNRHLDRELVALQRLQDGEVRPTLSQMRGTLGHADTTLQQVNQQLPLLSGQITQTLQGVNKATDAATVTAEKASATMGDVQPRLDVLLDESRQTATEARTVMGAMRNHWPFTGAPVVEPPAASGH